jgi:hypothetical protein
MSKRNYSTHIVARNDRMAFLIAAVTAHVPNHRQKYHNYYGAYSNKCRGLKRKQEQAKQVNEEIIIQEPTADQKAYQKTWAMLLRKVFEVDPLVCPKCQSPMKVISVITDGAVIRKILDHLGLWEGYTADTALQNARASPVKSDPAENNNVTNEPFDDGWGTNLKTGS